MLFFLFRREQSAAVFPQKLYFVPEMFFGAAEVGGKAFYAHIFARLPVYEFKMCADVVRTEFCTAFYALCHFISRLSDLRGTVCMSEALSVRVRRIFRWSYRILLPTRGL